MCLCVVVCVYLRLRYLTLITSTDEIVRVVTQFFISLCCLFWSAMYSSIFLFYLFCKFNLICGTNKVVVVVVVVFLVVINEMTREKAIGGELKRC